MTRFAGYLALAAFALFFWNCHSNKAYTSKPARTFAGAESEAPEINLLAWHYSDSLSYVWVEIKNEQLLYKRIDTSRFFVADVRVHLQVIMAGTQKRMVDSITIDVSDRSASENVTPKSLRSKMQLAMRKGFEYVIEAEVLDRNRKANYKASLPVDKMNLYGEQSFLITRRDTISFKSVFLPSETLKLTFTNPAISQVTVDCFTKEMGPALPPFSGKQPDPDRLKPDSTYILELSTNSILLRLPARGFCHLRTNKTNAEDGLTLYTADESFPGVSNSMEMIYCTRYIMERSEFEGCSEAAEPKAAIDKFWLTIGGSSERARELIKRYYGRVTDANRHYTSYVSGWKTDRGMIYIVFGQPTNVYKSASDEIWVYGNESNPAALRFIFNKEKNLLSNNDYILERSPFFKEAWYSAVEYWRQGNIYLDSRR